MTIRRKLKAASSGTVLRSLGLLGIVVILLSPLALPAAGSGPESWSEPFLLTSRDNSLVGLSAAMASDPYGYVHVFWIESRGRLANAILYSRFDGTTWTRPLELFVSGPQLSIGDFITASVDANDRLHVAWLGGATGPVFASTALASQTLSSQDWEEPRRIEAAAHRFRLLVDSQDKQHLIYTAAYNVHPGVYYLSSSDNWRTSSGPLWLNPEMPQGYTHDNLQAELDADDRLHVLWSEKELVTATRGGAIMYTRSLDGGVSWEPLATLDMSNGERLLDNSDPSLAVSGDTVHALWAGGEDLQYRNHRYSVDGGQTWNPVARKNFGDLHGQAQGDALTVDAAGQIHFVGHVRWPEGLYHATWSDNQWTRPGLFYLNRWNSEDSKEGTINAHGVRAVVRAGNQIVTTFYDRGDEQLLLPANGLYAVSYELSEVPATSVAPTPAATSPAPADSAAAATPVASPASPTPLPSWSVEQASSEDSDSPAALLWAGILPAFLIIIVIAFIRFVTRGSLL